VFVDLWRHPDRYDPAAGALRAYLTARARHRAVDLVRSELRRIAPQQRHHRLSPGQAQPSACEEVTAAEAASVVRAAVRQLPDAQRRVIELAYFDGLTYREVARAADIPEAPPSRACGWRWPSWRPRSTGSCWDGHDGRPRRPGGAARGLRERVLAASWQARRRSPRWLGRRAGFITVSGSARASS
jgi:Sigma-70, region 4/Sigma-70 region 2